jgi:D-serine ammonia-lyase
MACVKILKCNSPFKNQRKKEKAMLDKIKKAEEILWLNPKLSKKEDFKKAKLSEKDVEEASKRLEKFAPLIMHYFPETVISKGIIESPLSIISNMKDLLNKEFCKNYPIQGKLYLKRDSDLPVAGSVKARGGIYEVLKHSEDLALSKGLLKSEDDDYMKLASKEGREFFSKYKVQVGSTGNLGMSIGIMSAAIGYEAIVHMSADAKQWKKDLLRSKGVTVVEYSGDYSEAVEQGRKLSDMDEYSYFVDDENSVQLFLGYSVAGERLAKQLKEQDIVVNSEHPLFVYIPCGVGGAPGGIVFGLKLMFGDNVHCFFAEPTQAPCMVLGMLSEKYEQISVQDIGLTGITQADGLAVGRCSGLVSRLMDERLSGEVTVEDDRLLLYMKALWKSENIFIEPSACAAFHGVNALFNFEEGRKYIEENGLKDFMDDSTHIVWATGGRLMPEDVRKEMLK